MSTLPPGPPLDATPIGYATPPDARNGLAVAALVLGILGLVLMCFPVGLVGLILGIVALVRANALPAHKGRGLAIGGIVCSGVSLLLQSCNLILLKKQLIE